MLLSTRHKSRTQLKRKVASSQLQSTQSYIETKSMSVTSTELERNGHGISYITSGPQDSKLNLICVHGWACQASDYSYLFGELSRLNIPVRAIAVNLPGNGLSSTEHFPEPTIPHMAEAVLNLLSDLDINDVVFCGHSMGVRIITECWRISHQQTSPNVRGMVFLDGSHYKLRVRLFAFDTGDERSKTLSRDEKIAGMTEAFRRMFSAQTPMKFKESTLTHLRTMDLRYNERIRRGFIEYDHNHLDDALAMLGESGTPLLSFQATDVDDDNQRIPLQADKVSKWMQFLQEKVPQAQQVVVGDSMHFPHVDQPSEVAELLRVFLERNVG